MSINIYNIFNYNKELSETSVKVCRPTVLGNPYPMASEKDRTRVILKYEDFFLKQMDDKSSPMYQEVQRLITLYKTHGHLDLLCFCNYPDQDCHAEVIKNYIIGEVE